MQYAGADRKLDPPELHVLAVCVGQQLGVDPMAFGDVRKWLDSWEPNRPGKSFYLFSPFPMFLFCLVGYTCLVHERGIAINMQFLNPKPTSILAQQMT